MIRHAIVADNGLRYAFGHHHEFDRRLREELEASGISTTIFAHDKPVDLVAREAHVVPHFSRFLYEEIAPAADSITGFLDDYLSHNAAFARDMAKLAEVVDFDGALLIVPAATSRTILGLADWLAKTRLPATAGLAVVLPAAVDGLQPGHPVDSYQLLYRHALRRLLATAGVPTRLVSLSPDQSAAYAGLADHPVETSPYPVCAIWSDDTASRPDGALRVIYCGDPRSEKGFDILPEVVAATRAAGPNIEFVIQVTYERPDDRTTASLAAAGATIVSGFLAAPDFMRLIRHGDIVLLPYQTEKYRIGTSALFAEVAFLDRPMIVPDRTSMAAMMRMYGFGGAIAADPSPAAVTRALLDVASDLANQRRRATTAGATFRSRHGMSQFARFLLRDA
jgi:glycosyltransferase involved in cell wall biosynthesis